MRKIVRVTYPKDFSIGLLLLVFAICCFLSFQIFDKPGPEPDGDYTAYFGSLLVGSAVVIMALVLWEEFLFPLKVKEVKNGMLFRNHRSNLNKQALIYCLIPLIFAFIYYRFDVNPLSFFTWAGICIILPIAGRLFSGIKNYNDFLQLTDESIEYRNNKERGTFRLTEVQSIKLVKDERKILHKVQLLLASKQTVMIDLDEMELEAFFTSIDAFISMHYKALLK
jgi:hypothetical protein